MALQQWPNETWKGLQQAPRKALWLTGDELCAVMVMYLVMSEVAGEELVNAFLHVSQNYCRSCSRASGVSSSQISFKVSQLLLQMLPKLKLLQIISMKLFSFLQEETKCLCLSDVIPFYNPVLPLSRPYYWQLLLAQ